MKSLINLRNFGLAARFHIVGIGGIGMSGIAEILYNLGYEVQGSDLAENYNTTRLKDMGIKVFQGHNSENVLNADYVVISTSIKYDNPEYKEAYSKKIPIIKRSEMLAEIMRMKSCVSISGSHGKTSTTSMVASVFEAAGLNPTVINGGIINSKSTNAYVGEGDYLIVEADESDATFINIPSSIGIITNIDPEHLDYYKTFENLFNAFKNFVHNLPFYGFAVICADHEICNKLITEIIDRRVITYGIDSQDANIRAFNIKTGIDGSEFDIKINFPHSNVNYIIEKVYLAIPGRHNVLNCLAAVSVAAELDFGVRAIKEGLARFEGVKRRFTKTGEYKGARFVDDYAHHPAEVKATLATAKVVLPSVDNKILAIFQPHRYSRLSNLFSEFIDCFEDADELIISPVYAAGESKIEDFDHHKLANELKKKYPSKNIQTFEEASKLPDILDDKINSGDIVLFMGAGNITSWAYNVPKILNGEKIENGL